MPISGNSYYDDNQASGEKKKPFFKAYLDALKAGKQPQNSVSASQTSPSHDPAPAQSMATPAFAPAPAAPIAAPSPVMNAAYAPPPTMEATYAPPAPVAPAVVAAPIAPAAIQNRVPRRPAKRRRSTDTVDAPTPTASMDAMMQHILELAQKVEAAASKVEAVADKAEASARPSAEDGVLVTTRTNFSRPAPQHGGAHSGAADPAETFAVPPVASDPGFSSSFVGGQPSWRGATTESGDRDITASGLVTLEHEMSIPKVAPFILDKVSETKVSPSIPELRPVDHGGPDLTLTKSQDEPRPQGAPIVLRPQKIAGRSSRE